MSFVPIIDVAKIKKLQDEPKFGTVVANNDPDKLGKVKVHIPGIFEGEEHELPWIRRKMDTIFCGQDCEIFDVPEIGSVVEVKWNYDESTPMYSGAPYNQKHTTGAFNDNYPNEAGIKFGPNLIKFNKATKTMTIENGEVQIVLDSFGDLSIACNSADIKCDTDLVVHSPQTIFKGNVIVDGDLTTTRGASGAISSLSIAAVDGGIVKSIK